MTNSIELRQLGLEDMDSAANIHRVAFDRQMPWLAGLHTPQEDQWFYRERVFPNCFVWGASENGVLVGFIAFQNGWIDQLYVLPAAQGKGIGTALLDIAKAKSEHLSLWTFQRNSTANCFYKKRGFIATKRTDGMDNEEREPDVLYVWDPEH